MRYDWNRMTPDNKWTAIERELEMVTHNGITKDDLMEMISFLYGHYRIQERAFSLILSPWVKSLGLCILDLEGYDTKPDNCPDSPSHEDCYKCWKELVMTKAIQEYEGEC